MSGRLVTLTALNAAPTETPQDGLAALIAAQSAVEAIPGSNSVDLWVYSQAASITVYLYIRHSGTADIGWYLVGSAVIDGTAAATRRQVVRFTPGCQAGHYCVYATAAPTSLKIDLEPKRVG